ncbi:hypothetical protein RRG08_051114 [Elysia crispata]|uniref:FXYD domain-containing ion transport regulator n=1 Tax=Elysia crispata TaxID=231223 RepID=A0AAE1DZH9_9GAST|nr:hypothetical protein RRG08_051114 [Elysia crispata]
MTLIMLYLFGLLCLGDLVSGHEYYEAPKDDRNDTMLALFFVVGILGMIALALAIGYFCGGRRICHGVGFFKSSPRQDGQVVHQTKSSSTLSVSLVKRLLFLDAEDRPVSHFSKLQEFPDSPQSPQDEPQTVPVVEPPPQDESHTVAVVEPSPQEQKGKDVEITLTSVENPEVKLQ